MAKPLHLVNGLPTEVPAVATSAGAGDAGKLPELDSTGRIDTSMMPVGIGADTKLIEASENLDAGDYVNIHNNAGTANVRKADASAGAAEQAHGFVLNNVTSGNDATVYFEGANTQLSSLTPGTTYVLSHTTPGGVVALASASTTAGHIVQILGVATEATEINTEIAKPIVRG
jgi:hypothetical protein